MFWAVRENRLRKLTRSSGSRPTVGSSRIRNSGFPSSAWAMPTRWRWPPERVRIFDFLWGRRLVSARALSIAALLPEIPFRADI